jgi:hypothetical protein
MNRVTGGFLTAAIGVGMAVAWFTGAFGPLIATVVGLVRGSATPAATTSSAPLGSGAALPQAA